MARNPGEERVSLVEGFAVVHRKKLAVVGAILAAGGIGLGVCTVVRYQLRNAPGTPSGDVFVPSAEGGTLIVMDHVVIGGGKNGKTAEDTRLVAVDGRTGTRLATRLEDFQRCWPSGAQLACRTKLDKIEQLDPRTLETVATTDAARNGGWSSGEWQPASECVTTSAVHLDGTTLVFAGTRLTTDPPPPAESPTPSGPALTFQRGAFLSSVGRYAIVRHADSPQRLARVDSNTAARWDVALPGMCRGAFVAGGTLAVATGDREERALGIDLETGRVVWTLEF